MVEVLFVSKPIAPPWNDSSKNLARDVAAHLQRHAAVVMGFSGQEGPMGLGRIEAVYRASTDAGFAPSIRANLAVLRRLLLGSRVDLWHFFFAPNPRSSAAARAAKALRRAPSVQTVCSMPTIDTGWRKLLFADVTVALSRASYERFVDEGVPRSALRMVPPCVPTLARPDEAERMRLRRELGFPEGAPIWIYPGDLEHGGGAEIALQGFASWNRPEAVLVMACRPKTPRSATLRAQLEAKAQAWGIDSQLRWVGETPRIREMIAVSDFVTLVNRSAEAKMDYPLAALEAMTLGRVVLIGAPTPAVELAEAGGARAVEPDGDALADAVDALEADPVARQSLQDAGRALATTEFSPMRVAAKYEMLYEEILG